MGVRQLSDKGPDGTRLGQSAADKLAFYALSTPIARPSVTWPNTATATTALNELKANRLMAALVSLGLIVTT
ncbi:hypothetical protein [Mesorhizobium sp.]|uniref:hypothetical protein n=1 Tax=Mesorhizobium sp. TaxID=1871066 RepID=UPI000FE45E57|nr:hypothetical protein [Mesorhizobium sp.]RWO22822.1 MAG: hypothetical protein EOS09_19320 [Mesorhizobium sp.]